MKWKCIVPAILVFAAAAHADANVLAVSFSETLVYGTATFETTGGSVLSTAQYVYWGGEIPPDIANDIAADPAFSSSDPSAQAFLQATALEAALADDLNFLSTPYAFYNSLSSTGPLLPAVFYTSASPTVFTGAFPCCLPPGPFSTAFPAYAVTSQAAPQSVGVSSYSTGALDPSGTLYDGTVSFAVYQIDLVEQPAPAAPEPSALGLSAAGAIALVITALWRQRQKPRAPRKLIQSAFQICRGRGPRRCFAFYQPQLIFGMGLVGGPYVLWLLFGFYRPQRSR